jgi:membrane protein DedA with SNARE-associated domain
MFEFLLGCLIVCALLLLTAALFIMAIEAFPDTSDESTFQTLIAAFLVIPMLGLFLLLKWRKAP